MAPLQPIDRNISPDWPTLAEVVRTVAGNWDDGATTEEEVDEDGDLEGAFELPGRPVSLRMNITLKIEKCLMSLRWKLCAYSDVRIVFTKQVHTLGLGVESIPGASRLISSVNVVCAKTLDAVDAHRVT